jgi:pimeloyl-ACP methyl ester carboxylesterase
LRESAPEFCGVHRNLASLRLSKGQPIRPVSAPDYNHRVINRRFIVVLVIAWLVLAGGCSKVLNTGQTPIKAKTPDELKNYLLKRKPDLGQFRLHGPFAVAVQDGFEIRLSTTELIDTDLFLSAHREKAPLVIFMHGYDSTKESHTHQALHLASWGMHCLSLQLPNHGPWVTNGRTVAKIVKFIHRWPEIVDGRIDVNKIILVGHSFGAAAVAVALAESAPAAGAILLDPAFESQELPRFLRKVEVPVMVLGADERISQALNRENFYRFIRAGVREVSIRDATHEDAQYPSAWASTTEDAQITYASAITAAAFSLSADSNFDYAWHSFSTAFSSGQLFNARWK